MKMILPQCQYLRISAIFCSLFGIFPTQFIFENYKAVQKIYNHYSQLMLSYYIVFLVRAYIELNILITNRRSMDAISSNLCITLVYSVTLIRQLIIKLSPNFQNIIKQVINYEKEILAEDDQKIVKIYYDCSKNIRKFTISYISILSIITVIYVVRPALIEPYEIKIGNTTQYVRALPLSSWFPFNEQVNYWPAYLWSTLDSVVGASFVAYTDIFMVNLIAHPIGQLKILKHRLRNFESYKQQYKKLNKISDDEFASKLTFLHFIHKHRDIIEYIQYFNNSMGTIMVFDFLQSSLQAATVITQIVGNSITFLMITFVGATFFGMMLRLFLYYYHANEVLILSNSLLTSVWESNWYEQSKPVKYMMFIFIMRTQKPLKYNIGFFSEMSLGSLIVILKATYSYVMLMY